MKQKIRLAAPHLHNPDLVVLDEPFSGLDVKSALVLRRLIQSLAAEGQTVLFSSHELETVERVCSRAVILQTGKVAANGSADQLRELIALPSLEAIFTQLALRQSPDYAAASLIAAMRS